MQEIITIYKSYLHATVRNNKILIVIITVLTMYLNHICLNVLTIKRAPDFSIEKVEMTSAKRPPLPPNNEESFLDCLIEEHEKT